nr:hypothetical protein Iba_chr15eCG6330 [Ipomoea batatas]
MNGGGSAVTAALLSTSPELEEALPATSSRLLILEIPGGESLMGFGAFLLLLFIGVEVLGIWAGFSRLFLGLARLGFDPGALEFFEEMSVPVVLDLIVRSTWQPACNEGPPVPQERIEQQILLSRPRPFPKPFFGAARSSSHVCELREKRTEDGWRRREEGEKYIREGLRVHNSTSLCTSRAAFQATKLMESIKYCLRVLENDTIIFQLACFV